MIPPFSVTNTSFVIDTAHVQVTPSINGCTGSPVSFRIIVYPTPDVLAVGSQTLCNGASTTAVSFSGDVSGTTYSWSNNLISIGLTATGTGDIASFTATNITPFPDTAAVTVTPSANGCNGLIRNFDFVVNPTPVLSSAQNDTVCSEAPLSYIPESVTPGVSYTWNRTSFAHITPLAGSGSGSVTESLVNDTLVRETVYYTYTLTANGCSEQQMVAVVVNPAPHAPVIDVHPASALCSNTLYQNFGTTVAPSAGMLYNWSSPDIAQVWASGAGHQYCLVSFPEAGAATVLLTVNMNGIGCYHSDSFRVIVGNEVSVIPTVVYGNNYFICLLNNQDSYQWGFDDRYSLDSFLISGETNQNYYNPSPDYSNKSFWVITRQGNCIEKTYANPPTVVGTPVSGTGDRIEIYPNPTDGELNLSVISLVNTYSQVRVMDMLGKTIEVASLSDNKTKLDLSGLASGIYMLGCIRDGVQVTVIKFVKN